MELPDGVSQEQFDAIVEDAQYVCKAFGEWTLHVLVSGFLLTNFEMIVGVCDFLTTLPQRRRHLWLLFGET